MNALAIFMKFMNRVFGSFLNKFLVVFINDIMVYSKHKADHALRISIGHLENGETLCEA